MRLIDLMTGLGVAGLAIGAGVTVVVVVAVLLLVSQIGCTGCPVDDDDSAATGDDDSSEACEYRVVQVTAGDVVCEVTWPGTVDVYWYAALAPEVTVDGLMAVWASWYGYTEWVGVTYTVGDDCDGIPGPVVQVTPPDVAVVADQVLVKLVPGGALPVELLLLECAP